VSIRDRIDNEHPALRRWFHPVCRVSDLVEGALTPVRLLGQDWAVGYVGGELLGLIDRCPHRWAPLSAGCVIDGVVQCGYHGYRFDRTGTCVGIPALGPDAKLPPKARVDAAHSVVERYGLIWMAIDEPVLPVIEVPEWDDPAFVVALLPDQVWSAGAAQMVDNFLDLAHFPFTHLGTFGDPDDTEVPPYAVERDGWGLYCDYHHSTKVLADSMGAESFETAERRSIWFLEAPFTIRLRIEYLAEDVVLTILFFHQPVDATTTKLYCFDLRDDIADGRTTVEDTVAFQVAVAMEDKAMLERITEKWTPVDLTAEVHTRADRITVEYRRILADLIAP
jgi:vanillate O-demethylase monooxygenase subunit